MVSKPFLISFISDIRSTSVLLRMLTRLGIIFSSGYLYYIGDPKARLQAQHATVRFKVVIGATLMVTTVKLDVVEGGARMMAPLLHPRPLLHPHRCRLLLHHLLEVILPQPRDTGIAPEVHAAALFFLKVLMIASRCTAIRMPCLLLLPEIFSELHIMEQLLFLKRWAEGIGWLPGVANVGRLLDTRPTPNRLQLWC